MEKGEDMVKAHHARLIVFVAVAGLVVAGLAAMHGQSTTEIEDRLTPAVEIISFGETALGVAKLDTTTGEIWRFEGDEFEPDGTEEWVLEVRGVGQRAPGTFRIQQVKETTFLVDVATGRTWILVRRGQERWEWSHVEEHRSAIRVSGGQ